MEFICSECGATTQDIERAPRKVCVRCDVEFSRLASTGFNAVNDPARVLPESWMPSDPSYALQAAKLADPSYATALIRLTSREQYEYALSRLPIYQEEVAKYGTPVIELVFTNHEKGNPPFERFHADFASASEEVLRMRLALRDAHGTDDPQAYAGNAIAYGSGMGPDGRAIAWPVVRSAYLLATD